MSIHKIKRSAVCSALALGLTLSFTVAACSKDTLEETSGGVSSDELTASSEAGPRASTVTEEAEPAADEVPIAEDFEEEAKASIDQQNYRKQLDMLAREIEGDKD